MDRTCILLLAAFLHNVYFCQQLHVGEGPAEGNRALLNPSSTTPDKTVQGDNFTTEKDMLKHLLEGYDRRMRPVTDSSHIINVKIQLQLDTILDLDEKNLVMGSHVSFYQAWKDEFLHWTDSEYTAQKVLNIPKDDIWGLDLYVKNSVGDTKDSMEAFHRLLPTHAMVSAGGECSNYSPFVLYTECEMDLRMFPFDTQTCTIEVGSWMYISEQVTLELLDPPIRSRNQEFGEWYLTNKSSGKRKVAYNIMLGDNWTSVDYDEVAFSLTLKRKPQFYIYNIVIPTALIGLISIFSFLMSPQDEGRISLCLTTLLAIAVYAMVVADNVPESTSGVPILTGLLFLYMGIMTASTIWAVIIAKVVTRPKYYPPPSISFPCLSQGRQRKPIYHGKQDVKMIGLDKENNPQMEPLNKQPEEEKHNYSEEWILFFENIDRGLFVVFLCIYLLGTLLFLL